MATTTTWRPEWYKDEHVSAWERIKEALRRDWDQTKKDLHVGGHEMNQDIGDTLKQAAGKEALPASDKPNPPRVIGEWDDAEIPAGYGYAAKHQFGSQYPTWSPDLESKLRGEWEGAKDATRRGWSDVKEHVRYGYEYKPRS